MVAKKDGLSSLFADDACAYATESFRGHAAMPTGEMKCPWCARDFLPGRGQIYCSTACRHSTETAARAWAMAAIASGLLTVPELRRWYFAHLDRCATKESTT